jgi:hypothetical protein
MYLSTAEEKVRMHISFHMTTRIASDQASDQVEENEGKWSLRLTFSVLLYML